MLTMSTTARSGGKRTAFVINVVIHILYILLLPAWYFLSMFSVMLFDAPGSEQQWPILVFYYALNSYPYTVLGAIALAWMIYRKGIYKWTYPVSVFPAVIVIVCTALMAGFGE
ncbi:hypothetical protein [Paenibacillus sp. N3.4]|uniref:hypothetical protein n=1 Tax=Paenibacillus sp. N3.4 TaxID=2603222 RepID=UPI0011CC0592|nr:hypothetical protein [Paenibacillus sp. N3.4]TXK76411.1 hypothetical protein FU659_25710 [Paenibacillus sp. N3.4]